MKGRKRRSSKLEFEALEPRQLLTTFHECTLRAAIELANIQSGHNVISFLDHDQPNGSGIVVNSDGDDPLNQKQAGDVEDWICSTDPDAKHNPVRPSDIEVANTKLGPLPALTDDAGASVIASFNRDDGHQGVIIRPETALTNTVGQNGFTIDSDNNDIGGFVIQEWYVGIDISGSDNSIGGNNIGTDTNGQTTTESNRFGVWVDAVNDTKIGVLEIGGITTPAENFISGNQLDGVRIIGGDATSFFHNRIGLDGTGDAANPNGRFGILVDTNAGTILRDQTNDAISCGTSGENCLTVVSGNGSHGILIRGSGKVGSQIESMYVGTNLDGTSAVPNSLDGIRTINSASGIEFSNLVVSGNTRSGLAFAGGTVNNNWVHSSSIGVSEDDSQTIANGQFGIRIDNAINHDIGVRINGNGPAEGNVIGGNVRDGIYIANGSGHEIYGNDIGWSGDLVLGNGLRGILLTGSSNNVQVGAGSDLGNPYGNLIAGNLSEGIRVLAQSNNNTIASNIIRDNNRNGVVLNGRQNTVGTNGDGDVDFSEGNQIYDNRLNGVAISGVNAVENEIAGNQIGRIGTQQRYGVLVFDRAARNLIGTDGDGVSDLQERNDISNNTLSGIRIQDTPASLDVGIVSGVTNDQWTLVELDANYNSLVVVATLNNEGSTVPIVTRIRNASGNSFEVKVQRTDGSSEPIAGVPVHFIALEEGVYDGFEARKVSSTVTDHTSSWVGESQSYLGSYKQPVVVGQVMSHNDEDWSVFWAAGANRLSAPSSTDLLVGKHVGADSDRTRANETIGFIVFEAGVGEAGGRTWGATVASNILGADNSQGDTGIVNPLQQIPGADGVLLETSVALASNSTMRGTDGGWAVLNDRHPVSKEALHLVIDEDRFSDAERGHIAEFVSYVVFSDDAVDNIVSGNRIADNTRAGVEVFGSGRNYIGTHDFDGNAIVNPEGNQISGNQLDGITVENSHQTVIQGNRITGNNRSGIHVESGSSDTQIGVTKIADPNIEDGSMSNVILNNQHHGIQVDGTANERTHGTYISGNQLATLDSGIEANRLDGIHVSGYASTVIVGGHGAKFNRTDLTALSNTISGNDNGVHVSGDRAGDINVQQNSIFQSDRSGVHLEKTTRVLVGAFNDDLADSFEQNFIYSNGFSSNGNDGTGVYLVGDLSRNNQVVANQIGIDQFGIQNGRFNRFAGVVVEVGDFAFNEIRSNTILVGEDLGGVHVHEGTKNSILQNDFLRGNHEPTPQAVSDFIFLDPGNVVNDLNDLDTGANDLQNHPDIQSVEPTRGGYLVSGILQSSPGKSYRVEIFAEQNGGLEFLTAIEWVQGNSEFSAFISSTSVIETASISATATEMLFDNSIFPQVNYGSTSEFGASVAVNDGGGGGGPLGLVDPGTRLGHDELTEQEHTDRMLNLDVLFASEVAEFEFEPVF